VIYGPIFDDRLLVLPDAMWFKEMNYSGWVFNRVVFLRILLSFCWENVNKTCNLPDFAPKISNIPSSRTPA